MTRCIHIVAEAKVEGQVFAKFEVVLNIPSIVIRDPAGNMRRDRQTLLVRQPKEKTCKWITCLGVLCGKRSLQVRETEVGRRIGVAEPGELRVPPLKSYACRMTTF